MRGRLASIVIVVAIFGAVCWAAPAADAASFEVPLEHLVISPSDAVPDAYEVLDVFRLRRTSAGGASDGDVGFAVPLPSGHQEVQVLAGFRVDTVRVLPDRLEGMVEWADAGDTATVAVAYRVPASALPHPWPLSRSFAVGTLFVMLHPQVEGAVAGAEPAGTLEMGGATYVGYVRQNLPAGEPVLVVPRLRAANRGRGGVPAWAWAAIGLALAAGAAGTAVALRRRNASTALRRRRLVEAVLNLDAEFAAGYLEAGRYHALRRKLMQQLAGDLASEAAGAGSTVKPAAGGGGAP